MLTYSKHSPFSNKSHVGIARRVHPPLIPAEVCPKLFVILFVTLLTLSQTGNAIHLLSANSLILNAKPLPSPSPSPSQLSYSPSPSSSASSSSSSSASHSPSISPAFPSTVHHPTVTPTLVNPEYKHYLKVFEQNPPKRTARDNNKPENDVEVKSTDSDNTELNGSGDSSSQNTDTELLKLFESIDSRLNRMQQQIQPSLNTLPDSVGHPYRTPLRNVSPTIGSSTASSSASSQSVPVPLSPSYFFSPHNLGGNNHFWLSSIRNHFLNLESTLQAKLGSIETKLTNMDVESSIWKKTFAWKIDEINLRIVQSESKSSLTHEQILNKLDHFERAFHEVSSETISKIFHLTEKISKLEQSFQQRFNALEEKLVFSHFSPSHVNENVDLTNFVADKNHEPSLSASTNSNVHSLHSPLSPSTPSSSPSPNSENQQKSFKSSEAQTPQPTTRHSHAPFAFQVPKSSFLSKLSNSYHNSTRADSGKLKFAQRFMKLINLKQNLTMYHKTMRLNNTYFDAYMQQQQEKNNNNNNNNNNDQPTTPTTILDKNEPNKMDSSSSLSSSSASLPSSPPPSSPSSAPSAQTNQRAALQKEQIESMKPLTTNIHNRNIDTVSQTNLDSNEVVHSFVNEREIDFSKCQQLLALLSLPPTANTDESMHLCKQLIGATFQLQVQNTVPESQNNSKNNTSSAGPKAQMNIRLSQVEKRDLNEEIVTNNSLHPYDTLAGNLEHFSNIQQGYKRPTGQESHSNKPAEVAGTGNSVPVTSSYSNVHATPNVATNLTNLPPPSNGQPSSGQQQFDETLEALGAEMKADSKLDELDAKLQYFSTKIIKIVQEMWHSSRASENYLKQTLSISNETKSIVRTEMAELQHRLKPVDQLPNVIDEIREPLINRIQELSTALNNSVEVILNTQAQYINSCRLMRDEELQMQIYEVLEFFLNKSNLGLAALSHNMEQQEQQMNRTVEFMLYRLSGLSKQTMESVRTESLRLEGFIKSEIQRQIGALQDNRGFVLNMTHHALFEHLVNMSNKPSKSTSDHPFHSSPSSGRNSANGNQYSNECFISLEDFANICVNMDRKSQYSEPRAWASMHAGGEANNGPSTLSTLPNPVVPSFSSNPKRADNIPESHPQQVPQPQQQTPQQSQPQTQQQPSPANTLPHLYMSTEPTLLQNPNVADAQTQTQHQPQTQPPTIQLDNNMGVSMAPTQMSVNKHVASDQQPQPSQQAPPQQQQHSQHQQQPPQQHPQPTQQQPQQQQAYSPQHSQQQSSQPQLQQPAQQHHPQAHQSHPQQQLQHPLVPVESGQTPSTLPSVPSSQMPSIASQSATVPHYKPINQTQPISTIEINNGNR